MVQSFYDLGEKNENKSKANVVQLCYFATIVPLVHNTKTSGNDNPLKTSVMSKEPNRSSSVYILYRFYIIVLSVSIWSTYTSWSKKETFTFFLRKNIFLSELCDNGNIFDSK